MKHVVIILSLVLSVIIIAPAYSRDDSRYRGYGFQMLEDPVNPRNAAMGSAGTAMGGAGFRYYNPVLPFFSAASYVAAEFGQLPGELNKGGVEFALVFPEWFSAVDFYSSSVEWETRDERGLGSRAASVTTIGAATVGYISENFSVGVAVTAIEDRIWRESNYGAFALSGGLGYKLLDGKLNVGAAGFHGIARSSGFGAGDDAKAWRDGHVPRTARGGAAWIDTLKSTPYAVAADIVYRDEDKTFSVPVGVEVKILPYIDLRIGKRFGYETEIMSFGIGLNIDKISFDAAFIPSVFVSDYDIRWSMAFKYQFGGAKKPLTFRPAQIIGGGESGAVDIADETDGADAIDTTAATPGTTGDSADDVADAEDVTDAAHPSKEVLNVYEELRALDALETTDAAHPDGEISDVEEDAQNTVVTVPDSEDEIIDADDAVVDDAVVDDAVVDDEAVEEDDDESGL